MGKNQSKESRKQRKNSISRPRPPPPKPIIISEAMQRLITDINNKTAHMGDEQTVINRHNDLLKTEQNLINSLNQRLNKLYAQLDAINNSDVELYARLGKEIEALTAQLNECNRRFRASQNAILRAVQNIYKNTVDINIWTEKYKKLSPQMEKYKTTAILDSIEITDLSVQISGLEDVIKMLETKLGEQNLVIKDLNDNISELNRQIDQLLLKIYSNFVHNNENILKLNQSIDASFNILFSYLNKQNIPSTVYNEKIMYRDIEHEKLYNTNKILDLLFYCFYFSFIVIIICIGNINREKFLIYLFVALIPFTYPFLYKFILYLIHYLSNDRHGPKNAFVDINNTIYANVLR